jgi:hypothetical protein
MPPLSALLLILRDLGLPAVASTLVLVFASLISKGTLHRTDRIGAAAVAVGFAVGFQPLTSGGLHPEDALTVLPLAAVVSALLAPRVATRFAPGATIGVAGRAGLVAAGLTSAVALYVLGDTRLTEVALITVGAAIGLALGAQVGDREPAGITAPDPRVGAWAVVGILLVAVAGFGVAGVVTGG